PESYARSWAKVVGFAREACRDPTTLTGTNQLAILVGRSRAETGAPLRQWLSTEWNVGGPERIDGGTPRPRGHGRASPHPDRLPLRARAGRDHRARGPAPLRGALAHRGNPRIHRQCSLQRRRASSATFACVVGTVGFTWSSSGWLGRVARSRPAIISRDTSVGH